MHHSFLLKLTNVTSQKLFQSCQEARSSQHLLTATTATFIHSDPKSMLMMVTPLELPMIPNNTRRDKPIVHRTSGTIIVVSGTEQVMIEAFLRE